MIEAIDMENCTGCGECDTVCPADVIHMQLADSNAPVADIREENWLPEIKYREHCITCYNCEIYCPENIVDVHPSVRNRPRAW